MRRVILKTTQSPGDMVMLTAAKRDIHLSTAAPRGLEDGATFSRLSSAGWP